MHDRAASRFRCTAYADGTGAVSAEGEFVLARSHWDEVRKKASFERVGNPPSALGYIAFDGETLYLVDSMVLVPGGVISYR